MTVLTDKRASETVAVVFDADDLLASDEIITSVNSVTVSVLIGSDPSPNDLLDASALILPDNRRFQQRVTGGIAGVEYGIEGTFETSGGQTLTLANTLRVISSFDTVGVLIRPRSIAEFRELLTRGPAADLFDASTFSDELLWDRLTAAQGELENRLRVFLGAVQIIPEHLAEAEVPALEAAGTRYVVDEGYDYTSGYFHGNRWGLIEPRYTPIIDVQRIDYVYPIPDQPIFTIPLEWARPDRDGGFIRIVPAGTMYAAGSLNALILSMLSGGRTVPHMLQLKYRAGLTLERIRRDFPQLPMLIKHQALVMMLTERGFPSSTSISADGLSESAGLDIGKMRADVDTQIDQLRQKIHGLRLTVI